MKALILGTSSAFPTKERNHTAVLLTYGGESLLFDCGEGTQRQLRVAGENLMKISKIFITHWHGDHTLGLPGLIDSMAFNQGKKELQIYGPKGTKERIETLLKVYCSRPSFNLEVFDLDLDKIRKITEGEGYEVFAAKMTHGVPCIAYSFVEKPHIKIKVDYIEQFGLSKHPIVEDLRRGKDIIWKGKKLLSSDATYSLPGKKFTYVVDTSLNENIKELAKDADVLICEGTFSNELKDKAGDKGHLTVKQAAKIAKDAKVKKLVLTHFSQRYRDVEPLLKEAKRMFKDTELGRDFLEVTI